MKKYWFGFLVLLAVVLIACDNSVGGNDNILDETLAKVVVQLPNNESSRSVGLAASKTNTNYYEVYFRRNNSGTYVYYSGSATNTDTNITMIIPAGTYDILLLAGNKENYSGPTPLLLASSYETGKSIVLGGSNVVNLELATVDVDISCQNSIEVASTFNIDVIVDTKNPYVVFPSNYIVPGTIQHNFGINEISIPCNEISNVGNIYTMKFPAFTAPTSVGSRVSKIRINSICAFSSDNTNTNAERQMWSVANPDHTTLGSYYRKAINFTNGSGLPSVSINITWPN